MEVKVGATLIWCDRMDAEQQERARKFYDLLRSHDSGIVIESISAGLLVHFSDHTSVLIRDADFWY